MRVLLPVFLLAATPLPAAAQSAQLDAELLVAHPGLANGEFDAVREDWLDALHADPDSPFADLAAMRVAEINDWCTVPLSEARLARIARELRSPQARAVLADLRLDAIRRARAAGDPFPAGVDVYDEWLTEWRVAGPWGRPDAAEPLAAPASLAGLDWRPLRRVPNRDWVSPDARIYPHAGGAYAAILVRGARGAAQLWLDADERCLAWWNGTPIVASLHDAPTGGDTTFVREVELRDDWNLLLIATPCGSDLYLGARLTAANGAPLRFEQADAEAPFAADWMPSELRPGGSAHRIARPIPRSPQQVGDPALDALYWIHRARVEGHVDRALAECARAGTAVGAPSRALLLRAEHLALQEAFHLPSDVARGRMLAIENELIALDALDPQVGARRAQRLLDEDRPEDALPLLEDLQRRHPQCWLHGWLEIQALESLDGHGTLAALRLQELHRRFPQVAVFPDRLRTLASRAGARAEEEHWARISRGLGSAGAGNWGVLVDRAARRNDGSLAALAALARDWLADEPRNGTAEWLLLRIGRLSGDEAALLASHRKDLALDASPDPALTLAELLLGLGAPRAQALDALREATARQPAAHEARALLDALGSPADDAEAFFTAFGPDVDAALARRDTSGGASTALLLDHGMVYMLPDGGYHYRTHVLAEALDRAGTEELHEQYAEEYPLVTRVHDKSGQVFEPHQVEGTWVMPSLDPGDVVERVWDRVAESTPGVAPEPGSWRFASFAEPFLLTRWVLYVPDGLPGEFRQGGFDGSHETHRWRGGTVHVYALEDSARLEPEVLMPSELEVLPWAEFGADREIEDHLRSYLQYLDWQSAVPADVEAELRDFVAEHAGDGGAGMRAEALYDAVAEHVLDFNDAGDLAEVWTLRRGDPTGLLAALYREAGIEFSWALAAGSAPELDDDPVRPFESGNRFAVPLLRVEGDDGHVTWVRTDQRGAAFGDLSPAMAGAPVLVLERPRRSGPLGLAWREEALPRSGLDDAWALDFHAAYVLDGEDATVEGSIRITGADGATLREQLAQAPPEQLEAVARQICASLVEGMDLEDAEFPGLQQPGAPLLLEYRGRMPGFVRNNPSGVAGVRLRIPELGLSGGLGAAERNLPFAFRDLLRLRAVVELDCGDAWTLEYGPEPRTEQQEGFLYDFTVDAQQSTLRVARTFEMRGLLLAPDAFPAFLGLLAEIEQEESRAVKLMPADA